MSTTRYKIRLWKRDGEALYANAVVFDGLTEAEAHFNALHVSEEMPQIEFVKEQIANGCVINDEVLRVQKYTSVFEAVTKDAATLAALLGSLPVLEAPWDDEFHKRFCSSCDAENCDAENCPNNAFRNNPAWWLALDASGVEL